MSRAATPRPIRLAGVDAEAAARRRGPDRGVPDRGRRRPRRARRHLRRCTSGRCSASSASPARASRCRRWPAWGCCPRRPGSPARRASAAQELLGAADKERAVHPRAADRDDLPGPDDLDEPGVHGRRPARRGGARSPRGVDEGGQGSGRSRCSTWSASRRPGRALDSLPARVLRRHAPAGDDRHGDHQQPRHDHRRRADDRPRRHRAGADPRDAARGARTRSTRRSS